MKLSKTITAIGSALVMAVSMVGFEASAYGTAKFDKILAHNDSWNHVATTKDYSVDYCYGVCATSITREYGFSAGVPRFLIKTKVNNKYVSDYVDVYIENRFYTFDSYMCRGKKSYQCYVKNITDDCKCKVSGEFRFM